MTEQAKDWLPLELWVRCKLHPLTQSYAVGESGIYISAMQLNATDTANVRVVPPTDAIEKLCVLAERIGSNNVVVAYGTFMPELLAAIDAVRCQLKEPNNEA